MATSQLTGVNFEIDGQAITIFDAKGLKHGDDRWAINVFGGDLFAEIDPDTMMPVIHGCIKGDVEAGNEAKLAMLLLSPRSAVVFYLEGRLNRQHFSRAVEGPGYIDIPNVDIDGRTLVVRILGESEYSVATADSEGNVL